MECENEACDGCKKGCMLIHGKGVLSFFKFFPPRFARSVSHLIDQETYLEDSSGQRWRVTVCNHNGSLSIRQGWPKFSSDHGLNVGDFLVFHYVPGHHFIVKIFGTSGCEKMKSCSDIGNRRKRTRTYPEATTQAELFQTIDINPVKKKSKTSAESESEKVTYKPNIANFATNVDAETRKGQSVHSAIDVDESFCMIDRNSQYDQDDDRLCLHLSSFEMPAIKPLAEGTSSLLKGDIGKDNHIETNLRPAEDNPLPGPKYKKSNETSQFAREERVVKKEFEEITIEAFSPTRAIDDSGGEYTNGNEKVIKSEPADSGDAPSLNAVIYSCLLEIDGRDFLELPESWQKRLVRRAKQGRMIIYLRGPDKRIWPTFYHYRSGFNVLTCGWKQVTATYGLSPGDDCLFQLVDQQKHIFDVHKI